MTETHGWERTPFWMRCLGFPKYRRHWGWLGWEYGPLPTKNWG